MLAFLFGKPKPKKKKVIKLKNNKRDSKTLKGYITGVAGSMVAVKINKKVKKYRLRRGKGRKSFNVKIGKKMYTFKSTKSGKVSLRMIKK